MVKSIFLNVPVKDLNRSIDFFRALGFEFNPNFTDSTASCMILNELNYVMLLTHNKFKEFTHKEIIDSTNQTEFIFSFSVESRAKVDDIIAKAILAGGRESSPSQDHGFMFQRSFEDLDRHLWEVLYIDESQLPQ
jgi:uncharacterized protein